MRIALFADVHANVQALDACLRHAAGQAIGRVVFLGDLVGYGADPVGVLERVRARVERGEAIAVQGNHDAAVSREDATLTDEARAAIHWTRERLDPGHRDWLANLPLLVREHDACFVHASAEDPPAWRYITDGVSAARCLAEARAVWCVVGHVHEQRLWFQGLGRRPCGFRPVPGEVIPAGRHRRWLAVAGSVGQPRDGSTASAYTILDTARSTLTFHRVPYDHAAAAAEIRAAGLPERFARRLEGNARGSLVS